MKTLHTFSILLVSATLASASSLSVYQNKSIYTFSPTDGFIGLTKGVSAKCKGESVPLESREKCPKSIRICSLYNEMKGLSAKTHANSINMRLLESLISLPKPTSVDADKIIASARNIAKEETRLTLEKEALSRETEKLERRFAKEARSTLPLGTEVACPAELEVTLPYGYVTFDTEYEAMIDPGQDITVIQKLSILNKSGVDISASDATFHNRSSETYLNPVHFHPWIVSEAKPFMPQKRMKRKMAMSVNDESLSGNVASAPVSATYDESREYTVHNLMLPSTGEAIHVKVSTWKVPVRCQNELYPYRNTQVFEVCRFKPKYQIERNRWRVVTPQKVINEKAVGEYEKGEYALYTRQIEDIKVTRKKIVNKERQTGIFGGTARKKDGFVLTLVNKSNKEYKIAITERIPTSTTDKIKVKLLSVKSVTPIQHQLFKNGELKIDTVLAPHETRNIEVVFEISYDKDLKIDY